MAGGEGACGCRIRNAIEPGEHRSLAFEVTAGIGEIGRKKRGDVRGCRSCKQTPQNVAWLWPGLGVCDPDSGLRFLIQPRAFDKGAEGLLMPLPARPTGERCRWCGGAVVRQREWGASWLECQACGRPRPIEAAMVPTLAANDKRSGARVKIAARREARR